MTDRRVGPNHGEHWEHGDPTSNCHHMMLLIKEPFLPVFPVFPVV
jgi:hypothetical protein